MKNFVSLLMNFGSRLRSTAIWSFTSFSKIAEEILGLRIAADLLPRGRRFRCRLVQARFRDVQGFAMARRVERRGIERDRLLEACDRLLEEIALRQDLAELKIVAGLVGAMRQLAEQLDGPVEGPDMGAAHGRIPDQVQIAFGRLVEDVGIFVQDRQHQVARLGARLVRAVVDQLRVDEPRIDVLAVQLDDLAGTPAARWRNPCPRCTCSRPP